jgi:GNAT superfamily N-acetyltransferase
MAQSAEPLISVGVPSAADRGELLDALLAFNRDATGILDDDELSAFVRDDDGQLIGGIYGWVFGATGEVALLWVREDRRGHGLGGRLLTAFETKASALGCRQMLIRTHSFQAPGFYARLGYTEIGRMDDYPQGHSYHFLRKAL